MPSVATAPTADNAKTRAATTRLLGFYEGVGGAKVDALFSPENFVMRGVDGGLAAALSADRGTAALPSWTFTGDLDTGMWSPGANIVAWSTNGAERARIDATGRFGLGVTAPAYLMDVQGAAGIIARIKATGSANLGLTLGGDANGGWIGNGAQQALEGFYFQNGLGVRAYVNGAEQARLTTTGAGFGTVSPSVRVHAKSSGEILRVETATARGSGDAFIGINDPSGRKGYVGYGGASDTLEIANVLNGSLLFYTNSVMRWQILAGGALVPAADNAYAFGGASNRATTLFAVTGTINTSDKRFKIWLGRATEDRPAKDRRIARAILDELGWYQFTDAVTEKGPDGARWHFGARAQHVWAIVAAEGLAPPLVEVEGQLLPDITWTGPVAPAWLCFDAWNAEYEAVFADVTYTDEVQIGEEDTGILDSNGVEIMRPIMGEVERVEREPTGEMRLVREAGHIFGFRVDEMNLLLSWALHDRLSALETAA